MYFYRETIKDIIAETEAKALLMYAEKHRQDCREQGIRFEFDYAAKLDYFYPNLRLVHPVNHAKIMGNVYELLK